MTDLIKRLRAALEAQASPRYSESKIKGSRFSKENPPPDAVSLQARKERIEALKEFLPGADLSKVTDDELERMEAMVRESIR
jgi:sugar/nucleoside kinase (ribokinase family)